MKKIQSGRSMVEMLGVLAVMGVISIGGLYGYTYAMKRHRANELLNEANKRAVMVATDLMAGKEPGNVTVEESNTPYGQFNSSLKDVGDKFKMTISGLDEEVCALMEGSAGGPIRRVKCVGEKTSTFTAEMYFNKDLSTEERASDFATPDSCKSPYKWCSGSSTCVDGETCSCSGEKPVCKTCDTATGNYIADDYQEGHDCTTTDNKDGTCQLGECVENGPTCPDGSGEDSNTWTGSGFVITEDAKSITCYCTADKVYNGTNCISCISSGSCNNNVNICPGYYCSIAGGSYDRLNCCGSAKYTPGAGTVEFLGIPKISNKSGYLASPNSVASWDAAANYCDALKTTISAGVVMNGVNYSEYPILSKGLAGLPNGCSYANDCPALPTDVGEYWLDQLYQPGCQIRNPDHLTNYGSNSCEGYGAGKNGFVGGGARWFSTDGALCE